MTNKCRITLLGGIFLALFVRAAAAVEPPLAEAANTSRLARRLDGILADPALRHATVAVLVRSLRDNRVLYERNADLALVPASNQKLITAGAALFRLGPGFRFRTDLLRTGAVDAKGVLRGDLVLRGTGDPSLTSADLARLAQTVRVAGIRAIAGQIRGDDTRFDNRRLGDNWSWDDEPWEYQPQISALNCDRNVVTVRVAPHANVGAPALVTLDPPTAYARVVCRAVTVTAGGANNKITFDRARARNDFLVDGALSEHTKPVEEALTIEEPALYAVTRFAELLRAGGVEVAVDAPRLGKAPFGAALMAQHWSDPLAVLVRHFLKTSDNLYGEVLLKALGAEVVGEGVGAGGAGERIILAFLQSAGVDTNALALADGSGLSRSNAVTVRNLVVLLTYLHGQSAPPIAQAFQNALPIGGVDGTLRSRFQNTAAERIVRAKTGTLSGVSALSGYVTTAGGEPLVFSILMNNLLKGTRTARRVQDDMILLLANEGLGETTTSGSAIGPRMSTTAKPARTSRSGTIR